MGSLAEEYTAVVGNIVKVGDRLRVVDDSCDHDGQEVTVTRVSGTQITFKDDDGDSHSEGFDSFERLDGKSNLRVPPQNAVSVIKTMYADGVWCEGTKVVVDNKSWEREELQKYVKRLSEILRRPVAQVATKAVKAKRGKK